MPARSGRSWSWYRLAEPVARELVTASAVGRGDLVLDLGAGDGRITRHLAASGARVIAFELHPARATELRRHVAASNVKVVRADIRDLRLPRREFHVVANPPFDGASAILVRLTSQHSRLARADLVLPRSIAADWAIRLARRSPFRLRVRTPLPRSAFTPRPRIDCCTVVIDRS